MLKYFLYMNHPSVILCLNYSLDDSKCVLIWILPNLTLKCSFEQHYGETGINVIIN